MGYTKMWVHLVWATKRRMPVLTRRIRAKLFSHIREYARLKDIGIDSINGYTDHVHILVFLKADQAVARIVKLIKGESSYWINKNKLTPEKFEWQVNYFAATVHTRGVKKVRAYIKHQERHHSERYSGRRQEEGDSFIARVKFSKGG